MLSMKDESQKMYQSHSVVQVSMGMEAAARLNLRRSKVSRPTARRCAIQGSTYPLTVFLITAQSIRSIMMLVELFFKGKGVVGKHSQVWKREGNQEKMARHLSF